MEHIFLDIGIIIIMATVGGFIARALKQPLISFYIIMGVVLGPLLGLINNLALIDVLSEIGIAFLLFIVGIELDVKRLKSIGGIATVGAVVQMLLVFFLAFGAFVWFGFQNLQAAYGGFIILFSSTMVIVKLLSDKSQLDTLHGRIVVGTLLVQDVVAVILLSVMANIATFSYMTLIFSIGQALLIFALALVFSKVFFPRLFKFAAKSQELFFLLSLSVCFLFSLLFVQIGFSIAIGAFIAGIMLGNLPYNVEIIGRVKSLRDFFATLFFVSMGLKLTFASFIGYTVPFLVLLGLTILIAPLITYFTTLAFGYNRKTAFITAITLSQVSEFALIIVHQGVSLGHIGQEFLSMTIMVALTSIVVTSYMFKYQDKLYSFMLPLLRKISRPKHNAKLLGHHKKKTGHEVVLVGMDRIGYAIYKTLRKLKKDVLVVDFNPEVISSLLKQNKPCMYGDIGDEEVLEQLHLDKVKEVISTTPSHQDSLRLLHEVREVNKDAKIILTSYTVEDALELYNAGVDYVIIPHLLGGAHAGILLETMNKDVDKLIATKVAHISELKRHRKKNDKYHFLHDI